MRSGQVVLKGRGGLSKLMVQKQTSARAEGGKTIFQFNLVELGLWIIETLVWNWGEIPIVEWWDVASNLIAFGGGPEVSLQMYLGGFYLIYRNADGHIIGI